MYMSCSDVHDYDVWELLLSLSPKAKDRLCQPTIKNSRGAVNKCHFEDFLLREDRDGENETLALIDTANRLIQSHPALQASPSVCFNSSFQVLSSLFLCMPQKKEISMTMDIGLIFAKTHSLLQRVELKAIVWN